VLAQSLCPKKTTPAWCDQCGKFQPTEHLRGIQQLPQILSVNCGMDTEQVSPTTVQRCRSETEFILEDISSSVLSQFKKYHSFGDLILNNLAIFQSLIFRILMEKSF